MTRGIHTKPNNGESVDWLTPPAIVKALGEFDLDPCAHPNQRRFNVTATRMIALPKDGLAARWKGRVFLNPPYGQNANAKWLAKLVAHGNGIALVASRTEVERWFWRHIWLAADAVLFLRGRLRFHRPDGTQLGGAGHGSVLVAYGRSNADCLRTCGIIGKYFDLKEPHR